MAEVTREMMESRRENLRRQLSDAQTRLLRMEAAVEKARNDYEAVSGAMQELDEWERRLFGPLEQG